jgi:hypothetical protein
MFTDAFTLVFDERSAVFCCVFGCWAVLVELLPVGDCAWLVPDGAGFALCVCVFVFEEGLVCAWFEGVADWLVGCAVCAWLVELFELGAWVVLVPVPLFDVWPAAL